MNGRVWLGAAAIATWALPASAGLLIDRAELDNGTLVVAGQASAPTGQVTLAIGALSITLIPDATGRFAWVGGENPIGCTVTVIGNAERVRAPVAWCGPGAGPATQTAYYSEQTSATTRYGYGSSGYGNSYGSAGAGYERSAAPAPGIGTPERVTVQRTTTASAAPATTTTRTVTRRFDPLIISPNDPRYAQPDPPHWGQPEIEGANSGEVLYTPPPRGFYANIRGD